MAEWRAVNCAGLSTTCCTPLAHGWEEEPGEWEAGGSRRRADITYCDDSISA